MFKKIISITLSFCFLLSCCCTTFLADDSSSLNLSFDDMDYHSETDISNIMDNLEIVKEKKFKIPLGKDIIYIMTISESKEIKNIGDLSSKYVFERGEYYLKGQTNIGPIMKDHIAVKFTFDKNNSAYIRDPKTDIMYSKDTLNSKTYGLGGYYEVLYSTNQAIVSSTIQLYQRQNPLNKLEYADDSNLDIICDANGNIDINSKAIYAAGDTTKILHMSSKDIDKKTINDVTITSTSYNYLNQNADDNYKYICVRMDSIFKNKKDLNITERAYIEATFRYNEQYNECECIQTLYGNDSFPTEKKGSFLSCLDCKCTKSRDLEHIWGLEDKAKVYARTSNMTRSTACASGNIALDIPMAPDFHQNVVFQCDSHANITYNIGK